MNKEELIRAREIVRKGRYEVTWDDESSKKYRDALQLLLDLADLHIKCGELFGEREVDYDHNGVTFVESLTDWQEGSNYRLDECTAILAKKVGGIGNIEIPIELNKCNYCGSYAITVDNFGECPNGCPGNMKEIKSFKVDIPSRVIKPKLTNHFLGGKI